MLLLLLPQLLLLGDHMCSCAQANTPTLPPPSSQCSQESSANASPVGSVIPPTIPLFNEAERAIQVGHARTWGKGVVQGGDQNVGRTYRCHL